LDILALNVAVVTVSNLITWTLNFYIGVPNQSVVTRGTQKYTNYWYELAPKIFPFLFGILITIWNLKILAGFEMLPPDHPFLTKNTKDFKNLWRKRFPPRFIFFLILKQLFNQHRKNGCDYLGPDDRLDTRNDQFYLCQIYMSYESYDIKCHNMSNDAYDIEIWHQSNWSTLVSKRPSWPQ
jgi:hypothetical protein